MDIYLVLVVVLLLFAVFDIFLAVGNDAVNFLAPAVGSKVAPFPVILGVAAVGIIIGAMSAGGMMEIARSGIFVPSMFAFRDLIWIFVGVVISDVLLFNTFNSLGLPTSTSVSIVFELLGGSVAMALVILNSGEAESGLSVMNFINTGNVLTIISGILLSIVVAFVFGFIVQWITRLLFTFNYNKQMMRFGSLFGGVACTVISYFIIIKGLKQSSILSAEGLAFVKENTMLILLICLVFWTFFIAIFRKLFKMDVLKFVVLMGTFALALAFAGNDLVNFIGVPLAGLSSYQIYQGQGGVEPAFNMGALSSASEDSNMIYYLCIAGILMTIALWFARKGAVTKTSLNLSSQSSTDEEQFGSSRFARGLVRSVVRFSERTSGLIPQRVHDFVESRFEQTSAMRTSHNGASFDLLRASVNLIVASMLIAFGTANKLPLSTTYVTFIVAMASSLADGAWGRDTAVYRITGVTTVITGWFLTALIAFTFAFVCVMILHVGGAVSLVILLGFVFYIIIKTNIKKRKKNEAEEQHNADMAEARKQSLDERSLQNSMVILNDAVLIHGEMSQAFADYSIQNMKKIRAKAIKLDTCAKQMKDTVNITIKSVDDKSIDASLSYVQLADYLREIARSSSLIILPVFDHIDNNHKPLLDEQKRELQDLSDRLKVYIDDMLAIANSHDFDKITGFVSEQTQMFSYIDGIRRCQIKRAKAAVTNTRNSLLYMQILHETKQIVSYSMNVLKSYRDIVLIHSREKME